MAKTNQKVIFEDLLCPKCERKLKPSILLGRSVEVLECRYCKISVKTSLIREQKNPQKYIDQFKKIPENKEIKEEEREHQRLREEHADNMKNFKHVPFPEECPDCESKDIVADCCNNGWICLSCDRYFELREYRVMFHGDIELYAENKTQASEKGYELLRKGCVDIETEVM